MFGAIPCAGKEWPRHATFARAVSPALFSPATRQAGVLLRPLCADQKLFQSDPAEDSPVANPNEQPAPAKFAAAARVQRTRPDARDRSGFREKFGSQARAELDRAGT